MDIEEEGALEVEKEENSEEEEGLTAVSLKVKPLAEIDGEKNYLPPKVSKYLKKENVEVDLSVLTKFLTPIKDIDEKNDLWVFKTLKNEISATVIQF